MLRLAEKQPKIGKNNQRLEETPSYMQYEGLLPLVNASLFELKFKFRSNPLRMPPESRKAFN